MTSSPVCCHRARGEIRTLTERELPRGLSLRPTVTDGVGEAELVLSRRPFPASMPAFVASRAAESERFRVVRDYFRDYSDRQRPEHSELLAES